MNIRFIVILLSIGAFISGSLLAQTQPSVPDAIRDGGGFIVHVNGGDGNALSALRVNDHCLVQGLERDAHSVVSARDIIRRKGLYGPVSVIQWDGIHLPYTDGIVNFLVAGEGAGLSDAEILRVLAAGGRASVVEKGKRREILKARPAEFDEWTHFEHDAGRSSVSTDSLAGPPQSLRWVAGEQMPQYQTFEAPPVGFVSAGGRNFYWLPLLSGTARKARHTRSQLMCRDAFNGLMLWSVELNIPAAPTCMVAAPRSVYLHQGRGNLTQYDAPSGKVLRTFEHAIAAENVVLTGSMMLQYSRSGVVAALDVATGEEMWERKFAAAWRRADAMVAAGDAVYHLAQEDASGPLLLMALDIRTGETKWKREVSSLAAPDASADRAVSIVSCRDGLLILSDAPRSFKPKACANHIVSCKDGEVLWSFRYEPTDHGGRATNVFHIGKEIWIKAKEKWMAFDAATGVERRNLPVTETRCYPDHATGRFLFTGFMDFLDLQDGAITPFQAARSGCSSGFFPANGAVYSLPNRCHCYPMLRGYLGLSAEPASAEAKGSALEKGPAFGRAERATDGVGEWPVFRGDNRRSGSSAANLPARGRIAWSGTFGAGLSPATVAEGQVFGSVIDKHEVIAADAANGKILWRATTNARVDLPPTYSNGFVIFGCADGTVTSLAAKTGELAWRSRVAPAERLLVAREQVESAWPVHGSVLCADGKVYAVTGRHTLLDGGISVVALELSSGKELWRTQLGSKAAPELADLPLVTEATLYMGASVQLNLADGMPLSKGRDKILWAPHDLITENTAIPACVGNDHWFSRWIYAGKNDRARFDKSACHPQFSRLPAVRGDIIAFDDQNAVAVCQEFGAGENGISFYGADGKVLWQQPLPSPADAKCTALALGKDGVVLAGSKQDGTGWVSIRSRDDGAEKVAVTIPSGPVWDGLALANGRIFVTAMDGQILCIE